MLLWCDVGWYVVLWCGVVCAVWFGIILCDVMCCVLNWCDVLWYGVVGCDVIYYGILYWGAKYCNGIEMYCGMVLRCYIFILFHL